MRSILIESGSHLSRVALLEEGRLTELELERFDRPAGVGSVFKGRVARVLPGIEAAFVEIGLERNAFLFVDDAGGGRRDPETSAQSVDEESRRASESRRIEDLVRAGQDLLVQVVKDPVVNKGARITTEVTLPGRYLVLLPYGSQSGISRRIVDEEERARLEGLLRDLAPGEGSLIARTAAAGKSRDELERDLTRLRDTWNLIRTGAAERSAPALLHQDLSLELRALRDQLDDSVGEIWIEGEGARQRVEAFLTQVEPEAVGKLREDSGGTGLFDRFGLEGQIDRSLRRRVWLPSGGTLVISPTEALVAIDVNTGRFQGKEAFESTVLATNLEAAREVARQIRLRDLSGIIVVDFIDMGETESREKVVEALRRELADDRAKTQVTGISEFGLVQITRERSRVNLERLLLRACPGCGGRGWVRGPLAAGLALRRELVRRGPADPGVEIEIRVHPQLRRGLESEEPALLAELEEITGRPLRLMDDPWLAPGAFDIVDAD